ncbi:hypothetical protein QG37_05371 [Candidozyma auris]|nr:hypothetical protein QG37_05371 [[Candida] auris]
MVAKCGDKRGHMRAGTLAAIVINEQTFGETCSSALSGKMPRSGSAYQMMVPVRGGQGPGRQLQQMM